MQAFHVLIREARKKIGFATAKEFHRKKTDELSMSYESYANLEAGKYLPPSEKLTGLLAALEVEDVRAFIHSYCFTLMPNDLFKNLFVDDTARKNPMVIKNDSYAGYKEKFQA